MATMANTLTINENSNSVNPNAVIFDAHDIDYLVKHFCIEELSNEIRSAWKHLERETDWHWQFFYQDFIRICKLAIDILKWYYQQPKSKSSKSIDVEELKQRSAGRLHRSIYPPS